jgi:intracellular sulfur oxidation DsrE/DsrF family protein
MAVLIIARSRSTQFAYNNAMWAKYGKVLSQRSGFTDPKTKQPASVNPYNSAELAEVLSNRGTTVDALVKQGVHFGVCQVATRGIATAIVEGSGGNVDAVYAELTSILVGNAHMVPAGIITVNRAQERGYSLVTA